MIQNLPFKSLSKTKIIKKPIGNSFTLQETSFTEGKNENYKYMVFVVFNRDYSAIYPKIEQHLKLRSKERRKLRKKV
jgi:hypothetical protein